MRMTPRPTVLVFDVNETLSDMAPMADRFAEVGAPPHLAGVWFASLLRDGFALTAAGSTEAFARIGEEALRGLLATEDLSRELDEAVGHVMSGFMRLRLHPDVADAVRSLRDMGLRLVTLSNGSTRVAEALLTAGGVRDEFEALMSVEEVGVWKPGRAAYEHAARRCGTEVGALMLVAAHPWDIDGAARAGLSTAWVNRGGRPYPAYFTGPTVAVTALTELPARLAAD
jgi:2-haloacid dehalogenase